MTSSKSALPIKSYDTVPGWTPELGLRLAALVTKLGGNTRAGDIAGLTDEMISRYVNGRAKPNAYAVAAMANAAGVSLDWLMYGKASSGEEARLVYNKTGIDPALFGRIAEGIERLFTESGLPLSKAQVGHLAGEVYEKVHDLLDEESDLLGAIRIETNRLLRAARERKQSESVHR